MGAYIPGPKAGIYWGACMGFRLAADPDRLLPLMDLDLRDVGFLQQLDQLLDFAYVHLKNLSM